MVGAGLSTDVTAAHPVVTTGAGIPQENDNVIGTQIVLGVHDVVTARAPHLDATKICLADTRAPKAVSRLTSGFI